MPKTTPARLNARRKVCHLASVTWCALLLTLGCANASQEADSIHQPSDPDTTAAGGHPPDDASTPSAPSWCEARDVLERNCQRCHGAKPSNGAPFPLVTYEDTQTVSKKGKARFEIIAQVVESELMPPTYLELEPPVAALKSADRQLLLAWCEQGAPSDASGDCAVAD